jgi:MraZ protein
MLIGSFIGVLGQKRRTAIPRKFINDLGTELIIAKWYEGCLILVGKGTWEALLKRLTSKIEIITKPVRDTDRFILGSAFEITPDSQGRVVIPPLLASYANLKDSLVFIGLGDRVEIWDEEAWRQKEKNVTEHAAEYIDELVNQEKVKNK